MRPTADFSSPQPKALSELIGWELSRRPLVGSSFHASTLSNMNISETSWPFKIKFYLEYHWGGGLTAFGLGLDRIKTLISLATESSHRDIKGKIL